MKRFYALLLAAALLLTCCPWQALATETDPTAYVETTSPVETTSLSPTEATTVGTTVAAETTSPVETTIASVETTAATEAARQGDTASAEADALPVADPAPFAAGAQPNAVLFAASDFQADTHQDSAANVAAILQAVQGDYPSVNGLLFGGDYDVNYNDSANGAATLKQTVAGLTGMDDSNMVLVQGNHDATGSYYAATGNQDAMAYNNAYGVYVINEDDYMWNNDNPSVILDAALNLHTYLQEKVETGYDKPVFVISHLPLHYTYRTYKDGDGMYAGYIFDMLNYAGEQGLNVIYLYGHNHSHGWDSYLGYGSVYLAPGDTINIAHGTQNSFVEETLSFTYMNYGFVGYITGGASGGGSNNGSDYTLTGSVFEIYDDEVIISRYDADGVHVLKAAGALNQEYSDASLGITANTAVYDSPQSLTLTTPEAYKTVWNSNGKISVTAQDLTGVNGDASEFTFEGGTMSVSYTMEPYTDQGSYTGDAIVTLHLPAALADARLNQLQITGGTVKTLEDGVLTVTVPSFPAEVTVSLPLSSQAAYTRVTDVSQLESGKQYLIIRTNDSSLLTLETGRGNANDGREGLLLASSGLSGMPLDAVEGDFSAYEWTFTATGSQWYIGNGTQNAAFYTDDSGRYAIALQDSGTALTVSGSDVFEFSGDYNGTKYFNYNSTGGFINGYASGPQDFYIYQKNESDTTIVNGEWYPISAGTGSTLYRLVENGNVSAGEYLIVSDSSGTAYALTGSGGRVSVTVTDGVITAVSDDAVLTFTQSGSGYTIGSSRGYLYPNYSSGSSTLVSGQTTGQAVTVAENGTAFRFSRRASNRTVYLRYNNNRFSAATSPSNLYLFAKEVSEPEITGYARLTGKTAFEFYRGQDSQTIQDAIRSRVTVLLSEDGTGEGTPAENLTLISFSGLDTDTVDTSLVTVSYQGIPIGTIAVTIAEKFVTGLSVSPMSGTVPRGTHEIPGGTLTATYSDGSQTSLPMNTAYLSGGSLDLRVNGTYENLTVTYGGHTLQGYTLTITDREGNNFPDYPEPGSVIVDKTGAGLNFQSTGLARINLSATGLSATAGIDLVVVVDTSSSMDTALSGSSQSRIQVLSESLRQMLTDLAAPNEITGEQSDIDLAVVSFNGYSAPLENGTMTSSDRNDTDTSRIFTGDRAGEIIPDLYSSGYRLGANDFVNLADGSFTADDIAALAASFNESTTTSGTNYDAGLMNAYTLLANKRSESTEERQQIVVFLSDGAPFRYNGFTQGAQSSADPYTLWNKWLTGEWATVHDMVEEAPNAATLGYFYNGNGTSHPHRIAEAIKGTPGQLYSIVDRLNPDSNPAYTDQFTGLGATIYAVGFCLADDGEVTVATEQQVLSGIASGEDYDFFVNTAGELDDAFSNITHSITNAATDAVFEDQMGDSFELQLAATAHDAQGNEIDAGNDITVTTHAVYTQADADAGRCELADVGKTYGEPVELERITFNATGTEAYSSVTGSGVNILYDGKINAAYLTYDLSTETFTWNIGDIHERRYTLSYTVYLSHSMEDPGVPEGSYDTNRYARLTYTNYLGNRVYQDVPTPTLSWQAANVRYAFYLVDEEGNPLMANGEPAANFLTAHKLTNPVVLKTIRFNTSASQVESMETFARETDLAGYSLYDENASYTVTVHSDGGGSWVITTGEGKVPSTYVTRYATANDYSNAASSENEAGYDYSHTIVYFAVKWVIGAVDDTVVIDYGLPVDIDVLYNDLLAGKGSLTGISGEAPAANGAVSHDEDFTGQYQGRYGNAAVVNGKVRYTPGNMQMDGAEKFVYEAYYADDASPGYYYGNVTVIPATSIYYEDSFVAFDVHALNGGVPTNQWTQVGEYTGSGIQAEDRPGSQSLPHIDANNIYGYDGAYTECARFSLGTARKVTVVEGEGYATAGFTFTGTGFDVVSLTSNTTGTIIVSVTDAGGALVRRQAVDTYYGYTYENGSWTPTTGANALYQVPVMKMEGLDHGTYTVEIRAAYSNAFHHGQDGKPASDPRNQYNFYLDAIRIYDPAYDGAADGTVQDAYVQDNEGWPSYQELRNRLLDADSFTAGAGDAAANGIVYIDGKEDASIAQYSAYGPNNEVYLKSGSAVAFRLGLEDVSNVADVQIGIKSADGDPVTATCFNVNRASANRLNESSRTLNTATEQYYSAYTQCTADPNALIVLQNNGEGILSITNIKITYKQNPGTEPAVVFVIAPEEAVHVAAVMSLAYAEPELPPEPQPTEPQPTEPAPTQPAPTQPKPVETQPVEKPAQPVPTEPIPVESQPTEQPEPPAQPQPEPTEPQPEPTEPQPKPTEPQPEPEQPEPAEPRQTSFFLWLLEGIVSVLKRIFRALSMLF